MATKPRDEMNLRDPVLGKRAFIVHAIQNAFCKVLVDKVFHFIGLKSQDDHLGFLDSRKVFKKKDIGLDVFILALSYTCILKLQTT